MNQPVPRRRWPDWWRGGWPGDLWDPREFTQLWDRMSRMFESGGAGQENWVPTVETEETDDAYLVRAELPGMKRDDVDVELRGSELRVTGEVKTDGDGKALRQRRGKFAYRTSLPADADVQKINAQLSDGILTVWLPKAAQAQSRRIEIKS